MQRVVVVGNSGSGKTTLARRLAGGMGAGSEPAATHAASSPPREVAPPAGAGAGGGDGHGDGGAAKGAPAPFDAPSMDLWANRTRPYEHR